MASSGSKVKEIIYSYMRTQSLIGAVKLNIFDTIQEIGGDVPIATLGQKCDVDSDILERLLNVCVNDKLLTKTTTTDGQVCLALTSLSERFLTSASDFNLQDVVSFLAQMPMNPEAFVSVAKKGKGSGKLRNTCMKEFAKGDTDKKFLDGFMKSMDAWARCGNHFFRELDLSAYETIMDLGGCKGTHARTIKKQYPNSKVILADVPMVIEYAQKDEANKGIGLELKAVDFFDCATLPNADLVVMAHIIHDWNDTHSDTILTNVFNCIKPGGKLMLMEKVLTEDKTGPFAAICTDINMLSKVDGQERTFSEYKRLLERCGFTNIMLQLDEGDPCYDVIFATKSDLN